ncbi:hypothetical protein [Leifsonia shinshuensis]
MNNITDITVNQPISTPLQEIELEALVILHRPDEYAAMRAREREMARRVLAGEDLRLPLHDLQQRSVELRAQLQRELEVSFCRAAGIEAPAPVDAEAKGA